MRKRPPLFCSGENGPPISHQWLLPDVIHRAEQTWRDIDHHRTFGEVQCTRHVNRVLIGGKDQLLGFCRFPTTRTA